MPHLPADPDIRRQMKDRLLNMSPRAFEYFAGDLLTYIGLQNVAVTKYVGDGGIDAQGELIAKSGFVRIPTCVQVKRHRHNVRRPDIDRFIGAMGGQYSHGIFITTASYAEQAREKARTSPLLKVSTVDGDTVVALMAKHRLGVKARVDLEPGLDEDYFLAFEARVSGSLTRVSDERADYEVGSQEQPDTAVQPGEDLISMHALGYELRIDPYTVQGWVRNERLKPDQVTRAGQRESYFFRRDRIETIRQHFVGAAQPTTGAEWRQEFLDYSRRRGLTRSYKPVLLKALLQLVNRNGEVHLDDLAREFHAYYLARQHAGLPTESDGLMVDPSSATLEDVMALILKHPLHRFVLQHFLEYEPSTGHVRFASRLWEELRFYELLDVQTSAEDQLRYYYDRQRRP